MKRWVVALCGGQVALGLALVLGACDACRKGPDLAWIGIAYYGLLALICLRFERLSVFMIRWGFAVHLALVASGKACPICLASAGVSLALLAISIVQDTRPAWKWGLEFAPLVITAFAVTTSLAAGPILPASETREILVFKSDRCPHCVDLEERVLPRLPAGLKVIFLDANQFDYIRMTPTIVVRGFGETRVFEGVPPIDDLLKACQIGNPGASAPNPSKTGP